MNPSVVLLIVLAVIFLIVAGAFAWQEQRSRAEDVSIYSVEDSIAFVVERLSPETAANVKPKDVRRILEWEVRYLQDPAVRGQDETVIAGGLPSAEYAQQTLLAMGYPYDGPEIIEVLDLRARYLASIGAVGDPLSADEVDELNLPREPSP
jgi:hypothetical protein